MLKIINYPILSHEIQSIVSTISIFLPAFVLFAFPHFQQQKLQLMSLHISIFPAYIFFVNIICQKANCIEVKFALKCTKSQINQNDTLALQKDNRKGAKENRNTMASITLKKRHCIMDSKSTGYMLHCQCN